MRRGCLKNRPSSNLLLSSINVSTERENRHKPDSLFAPTWEIPSSSGLCRTAVQFFTSNEGILGQCARFTQESLTGSLARSLNLSHSWLPRGQFTLSSSGSGWRPFSAFFPDSGAMLTRRAISRIIANETTTLAFVINVRRMFVSCCAREYRMRNRSN